METKNKDSIKKFYTAWWFWVIMAIVFLGVLGSVVPSECDECEVCDCSECEADLAECIDIMDDISFAWNNYIEAFEDYCEVDPSNLLCSTIPY